MIEILHSKRPVSFVLYIAVLILIVSCNYHGKKNRKLFTLLKPSATGIDFRNDIKESVDFNIIIYQDMYSGGGVSIGDLDNDGLPDVFLTGNMVPSRLYKNTGDMKFKDITQSAGLSDMGPGWYTGTTMADVNNDGLLDIYVCKSGLYQPEYRRNLLFINNGNGTFSEKAHEFGIDHDGYGVNAAFFDYDNDGDLDMFLVNQGPEKFSNQNIEQLRTTSNPYCGDKLYENIGNKFIDVTEKAGIISSIISFGHGVAIGDINNDGWEDIFVSNDFFEYDYLYLNNGNKTFRESVKQAMKHISNFSMGNDLADFNNDGWLDIIVVDMVAEDNRRLKENLGGKKQAGFEMNLKFGFYYQYMYNMLHLNNGNETFSEIGMLSGISYTDWSWGPLLADFDNDGRKDIYITNGIRKDIRNIDWGNYYKQMSSRVLKNRDFTDTQWGKILNSMPSEKLTNYMFKNKGDLTFGKVMDEWGLTKKSFSNGAAYADLDNDGDLDLVVNNIDDYAFVYENEANERADNNYVRIRLDGSKINPFGFGTKVKIFQDGKMQYQQQYLSRGYRSSVDPIIHFGLGNSKQIDSIETIWPDMHITRLYGIKCNQLLDLKYADSTVKNNSNKENHNQFFQEFTGESGIDILHIENEFNDFTGQPLLPYRVSNLGPSITVGDVNGDKLQDFYMGGAFRHSGHLFIQNKKGKFIDSSSEPWASDRAFEDMGTLLFDADGDGDKDLYIATGGGEFENGTAYLVDRMYLNDGKGNFKRSVEALPSNSSSNSCVVPCDFDLDGDIDLFIGGRLVPGKYPGPANSYIYLNNEGKFKDVTGEIAPELNGLGMVTSAVWTDYDLDKDMDLIIAGEWMPITIFQNNNNHFRKIDNSNNGLAFSNGWWWSITAHDFDKDGDEDLVAGNQGLNYRYKASKEAPFEIYYFDFDHNNKGDIVFGYYNEGKLYPLADRVNSLFQIPSLGRKFPTNNLFSKASLYEVYGNQLDSALNYKAYTFASSYIEDLGNGQFRIKPLDNMAQFSNQNAIVIDDIDQDGNDDIIMGGNLYSSEAETIRSDAGIGIWLKGDNKGNFIPVTYLNSGLYIDGDIKDIKEIKCRDYKLLLVAKNNDRMQVVRINPHP